MDLTRRDFLKVTAGSAVGAGALGFDIRSAEAAVPSLKISAAKVSKNVCVYCSVSCGVLVYSQNDGSMNAKARAIHVEGNPDDPVNRGTLCPKGASLLDFVHSPNRLKYPEYRAPGATEWKRVEWDWALDRIARLMKDDRDKNFVAKSGDVTVNRWLTTAFLAASASSNESGYITNKVIRALGMTGMDNQARV